MDIGTTLLEYGADTDAVTRQGISPIHLAAQDGSVDMVSLLLAKNANVNVGNKVAARSRMRLVRGSRGRPLTLRPCLAACRADSRHCT